jgi:hypothetical protein
VAKNECFAIKNVSANQESTPASKG